MRQLRVRRKLSKQKPKLCGHYDNGYCKPKEILCENVPLEDCPSVSELMELSGLKKVA